MSSDYIFKFLSIRPAKLINEATRKKMTLSYKNETAVLKEIRSLPEEERYKKIKDIAKKQVEINYRKFNDNFFTQPLLEKLKKIDSFERFIEIKEEIKNDLSLTNSIKNEATQLYYDEIWNLFFALSVIPDEKVDLREKIAFQLRVFHFYKLIITDEEIKWNNLNRIQLFVPSILFPENKSKKVFDSQEKDLVLGKINSINEKINTYKKAIEDIKLQHRVFKSLPDASDSKLDNVTIEVIDPPIITSNKDNQTSLNDPGSKFRSTSILVPKSKPWLFESFGKRKLKEGTQTILNLFKNVVEDFEPLDVISFLDSEIVNEAHNFLKTIPIDVLPYVKSADNYKYLIEFISDLDIDDIYLPDNIKRKTDTLNMLSPKQRGIQPLGIGDLMIVRQTLIRYGIGEIAHIENIMKSESNNRKHTRILENEETVVFEIANSEEIEKDLQTTEKHELHKEAEKIINVDMKAEAGFQVSGEYGPVKSSANGSFSVGMSTLESSKNASDFAKEVINRSVSKIMNSSKTLRTTKNLQRVEETNEHGYDNTKGNDHVIGVYKWVDKYYEAKLVNYGKRLMIEFVIPEPSTFFKHTFENKSIQGVTLRKPEFPKKRNGSKLQADYLNKANYLKYIAEYNVQDAIPFPENYLKVSVAIAEGFEERENFGSVSEKLTIPQGYKTTNYEMSIQRIGQKEAVDFLYINFAGRLIYNDNKMGGVPRKGLSGMIPISVSGICNSYNCNINAICELTESAIQDWQIKTFQAIINAYENALETYNEQVAIAELRAGSEIRGRNPEINRKIEKEELKRASLILLTNDWEDVKISRTSSFDGKFSSIDDEGNIDTEASLREGKVIQFFEEAFEWHNMTYKFFPYFYGREEKLRDTFSISDSDPLFTEFLRAGAARVVIPVDSKYIDAVLHFLETGRIWNGGTIPKIEDALYNSLAMELQSETDDNLDDCPACSMDSTDFPCVEDKWEIKVPTSLVYLQPGSDLNS